MSLRTVGRSEIVDLNLTLQWDVAGVPQPVVRGRASVDGPGTTATGVRVGEQTFPRLRQFGRPDTQFEPLVDLIKRTAAQVGTSEIFELTYP